MNTKYQIQIKTINWDGYSPTITKEITLNDLCKFSNLASIINKNSGNNRWNWFGKGRGLPDRWDGKKYVLDTYCLLTTMDKNFGYKVEDVNLIKEFFSRFTPHGCDGIEYIKFFKVEEITDNYEAL